MHVLTQSIPAITNSARKARKARTARPLAVAALALCLAGTSSHAAPGDGEPLSIWQAAESGNVSAVTALLREGTAVDSRGPDGATALHYAAESGNVELADVLLEAGADVTSATRNRVTPLALAALNGHATIIERLLAHGADANELSAEGESALMLAALNGRVEAVRTLLAHGANPNVAEPYKGQTALMWAAGDGNADAVRLLLEAGAEIEARSTAGFTALLFAVREARLEALEVLIDAGANVDALAPDGTSALNVAIVNGYYELASALLDHGADPTLPDARGSPLHTLAWLRYPGATGQAGVGAEADAPVRPIGRVTSIELARKLLAKGADPNARIQLNESRFSKVAGTARNPPGLTLGRHLITFNGATAFYIAAKNGDPELMRVLVEGGADPTLPNAVGVTPLMVAAGLDTWEGETPGPHTGVPESQRLEAVKLAIELGNDVNARADFGDFVMEGTIEYTLLYYPHNIEQLAGLGVGDPRWDDCTALHGSIISNQPSITAYLLEQGAEPGAENALGWTPLAMSRGVFLANASREFPEAEALLLAALEHTGAGAD